MSFQRSGHLNIVTIVRGQKISAHQEENDASAIEVIVNLIFPVFAGANSTIMPFSDHTFAPQKTKVRFQTLPKSLVLMGIRVKKFHAMAGLSYLWIWYARVFQSLEVKDHHGIC
jgi:hypothetical protein